MTFRPLALALLVCGCYRPLPTRTLMGDVQFPLRSKQLPSGLRIILEEAKGSGRVAVLVGVAAGSSSDPFGKEGLAHVVEHLTFRARPADKLTIRELHEFLGSSQQNAATELDLTSFQSFGVSESLIEMVKIEVARLAHPLKGIDARVFDLEREIVRNELRLKLEAGISGESLAAMQALVFPFFHRYQRPTAGTAASLASLTLEDATAFTAAYYQPKNVTLVVVGDFDSAAIEADLLDAFPPSYLEGEPVARAPVKAVEPSLPPPAPLHPPVVRAGVDSTHLMLAWPGPAEDGSPTLISLERSLDAALSARWVDKDIGPSSVVILRGAQGSMVIAVVSLKLGLHPEESLAVVRNGLQALFNQPRQGLGTPFDKGMVLSAIVGSGDLMSRAQWRLEGTCYANDPRVISRTLKGLAALTPADQSALARKWLRVDWMRAVIVEPLLAVAGEPATPRVGVGLRPLNVQIPAEAVRALARGPQLGEVKELTLRNGLRVVAVRRPELPIVSVALALPGGRARGPVGVAQMSSLYVPPPRRRSESAGGVYLLENERQTLADATVLQWHGGNGNLSNLLALANNFMTDSRPSDEEIKDPEGFLIHLEQRDEVRQARDFNQMLYRGAAIGQTMAMADANTAILQGPDWAKHVYVPSQSALAIVGDIEFAGLAELLETQLSDWKNDAPLLPLAPAPPTASKPSQVLVNHVAKLSMVSLQLGCLAPTEADPLTSAILSTLLGQRLDRLWRHQLGASYGVTDSWSVSKAGSALSIHSVLDARRLTSALRALKQEWEVEVLNPEEIDRARWMVAAERSEIGVTVPNLAHYLALARLHGQSAHEAAAAEAHVADIPAAEVQAAFELCRGSTVMRLDGDETVIREALKQAAQ